MDLNLEQKKVLVTGVASGIGYEQAKLFLENGASVIGIDKDECDLQNQNFSFYQTDVTNVDALKQVLNEITTIDIVCNTAGILDAYHSISQTSFEEWNQVINTNLTSQFVIAKELLPLMIKQQSGVFINMASIAGKIAGGGGAAYTASKHAVIGFTKQLNFDYAKNGIRANCIAPGAVMTNMNSSDFNNGGEIAEMVKQSTPAQRYATAKEIAELTLFLASDKAQYIYGETITIDGGWSIDKII
ncbi:3-oxoacyl-ACP reductase [Lactobacillus sp. YT155]|uniref:3-oxoacyl-ACP reductase n=1 Tax=Lactobacillus sp. YT155 TaxID=3060955 RepID=UPI00265D6A8A|nr:3-oxoacyl-ACP reductase [Lactobacillus sp. YT155]MDO1605490.1 3-oxoacyl-ACP reductase [Lactobacillus sp. YT155]